MARELLFVMGMKVVLITQEGQELAWEYAHIPSKGDTGQLNSRSFVVNGLRWNMDEKICYIKIIFY